MKFVKWNLNPTRFNSIFGKEQGVFAIGCGRDGGGRSRGYEVLMVLSRCGRGGGGGGRGYEVRRYEWC